MYTDFFILYRLDATLLELSSLIMTVNPEAHRKGTVFDFAIVSPDTRSPGYRMRDIGSVCSGFPSDFDKIMLKVIHRPSSRVQVHFFVWLALSKCV